MTSTGPFVCSACGLPKQPKDRGKSQQCKECIKKAMRQYMAAKRAGTYVPKPRHVRKPAVVKAPKTEAAKLDAAARKKAWKEGRQDREPPPIEDFAPESKVMYEQLGLMTSETGYRTPRRGGDDG